MGRDPGTGSYQPKPPRPRPASAPRGDHAASKPAIHDLIVAPPPKAKPARRPATPIVTEHTHGQAHPSTTPANRHGLPADYGVTPHPAMSPGDVKHFQQESLAAPYEPLASFVGRAATNLAEDAVNIPGGLYAGGKALYQLDRHGNAKPAEQMTEAIAKQFVESLAHPNRRPGDFALNLLGAGGAVAGTAARIGATADAIRAGEGAAALTRPAAEGGSLLHKPLPAPRTVKVGDLETHLLPSGNPLMRLIQGGHDRVVQKAITDRPQGRVAKYGNWRVGNSLQETRRYVEGVKRAPAQVLAETGKHLGREEQAALRLTAEQATPGERIAMHEKQAQAGVSPEQQAKQLKILRGLEKRGLVTVDEHGQVTVSADHPELAAVDRRLAAAGLSMDKIVEDTGQMTAHDLASRRDRPNVVTATGKAVPESEIARGGAAPEIKSPALERQRGLVDQLQTRYEAALVKAAAKTKPRTAAEARVRLDELDKWYEAKVSEEAKAQSPYLNPAREQAARNSRRPIDKARHPMKTVTQEARDLAEQAIQKAVVARPDAPFAKLIAERDRLTEALHQHAEKGTIFEGLTNGATGLGRVKPNPTGMGSPSVQRLGGGLSLAKDRLRALETQVAEQTKRMQPPDRPATREGRQYVPYFATEPKGAMSGIASGARKVVGKAKPLVSKGKHYTGESTLHGSVPENTTGLVARALQRQIRYASTDAFRRNIAKAGSDARRSQRDVLVNTQELKTAKVPEEMQAVLGNRLSTLDELDQHATAFEKWRRTVIGHPDEHAAGIGDKAPEGYKWVDSHLLGDLAHPAVGPSGRIARGFDTINAAQTAATVYLKPGHISTRALTNAATNIIQGSATPVGISRSARLWHGLDEEGRVRALAAAGEGGIHALPTEGQNLVGAVSRKGALWWSKHIDAPFRFNSLAFEARKYGIRTPAQFSRFLHDLEHQEELPPKRAAQVDTIAKNANREAIAYDRLGPAEKKILRRAIWFYPWIKGATIYAGRTILEHPVKSAVATNIGRQGAEQQRRDLGPVPSYAAGIFKVGGSKAFPLTSNAATVSPFSTPAEVAKAGVGLFKSGSAVPSGEKLASFLTPAASLTSEFVSRTDPQTGNPLKGNAFQAVGKEFEQQTPEATLYRRLTQNKTGKLYPLTAKQAAEQILVGAEAPKTTSQGALTEQALKEQRAALSPVQKAQADGRTTRNTILFAAKKYGLAPAHATANPPPTEQAIRLHTQRAVAYAKAGLKSGTAEYQRKAFEVDIKLLLARGIGDKAQAAHALEWVKTADAEEITKERDRFGRDFFGGAILSDARRQIHNAERRHNRAVQAGH